MPTCYNKQQKIAFIHVPKCCGTAISHSLINKLKFISTPYYQYDIKLSQDITIKTSNEYKTLSKFIKPFKYTIIGVIRNPINWLWSGYNFMKYDINLNISFEQHLKYIISPLMLYKEINSTDFSSFYWHCCLLPDKHFSKNTMIFRYEKLYELEDYLKIKIPNLNYPPKATLLKKLSKNEKRLIEQISKNYALKWNYDINV